MDAAVGAAIPSPGDAEAGALARDWTPMDSLAVLKLYAWGLQGSLSVGVVLDDLIETALENNKDLQIAAARVAESRAALGFSQADLYPFLDIAVPGSIDIQTGDDCLVVLGESRDVTITNCKFTTTETALMTAL